MLTLLQNDRIDQVVWFFTQVNDGLFNFFTIIQHHCIVKLILGKFFNGV